MRYRASGSCWRAGIVRVGEVRQLRASTTGLAGAQGPLVDCSSSSGSSLGSRGPRSRRWPRSILCRPQRPSCDKGDPIDQSPPRCGAAVVLRALRSLMAQAPGRSASPQPTRVFQVEVARAVSCASASEADQLGHDLLVGVLLEVVTSVVDLGHGRVGQNLLPSFEDRWRERRIAHRPRDPRWL